VRALVVTNLFPPLQLGGYELSCAAFVEHLRAHGHTVCVLTTQADVELEPDAAGSVHRSLLWYRQLDGSFASPGWLDRCQWERHNRAMLRQVLREFDPDAVMWWNMGGLSMSLIELVRRAGLPAVGVVCDYWMIWGPTVDPWLRAGRRSKLVAGILGGVSRVPMRVDFARAARWVFVSSHVLEETLRAGGDLPRRSVVHTGIAVERFKQAPPSRTWAGRLLMVGRPTPNKGVGIALKALAGLPRCTLDIYGGAEGETLHDLEQAIASQGLGARVTLHPHLGQAEIERLYAAYDALLFPVRWDEPWGRVPLEAMASRVPVIAAARGGAREYLRHEHNCLVAYDADGFRAAVERLASDEQLRAQIEEAGRLTARRYDISLANKGREAALHQAIAEGP
jgi:glycogen synthase